VLAVAQRARAEAFVYTGRLKLARVAYQQACGSASVAGDRALLGQILVGRIGTLLAMGDTELAQSLVPRTKRLLARSGDTDYLRRLYINLGSGHYHREQYAAAHKAYAGALRLMEAAGQRDHVWASLALNQAIACTQLSRVEEARQGFRQAEAYGRAHGMDHLVAQAVFNLGVLEELRGDYRAALRLLAEAEDALARLEARDLLAACYLEQAQIHLDLFMPGEARELARRAFATFSQEEMLLDAHLARLAEARSLSLMSQPADAAALLLESERFYRRRRIQPRRAHLLLELARARQAQGERTQARAAARTALALAERHRLDALGTAARCFLADLLLRRGRARDASALLRRLPGRLRRLPAQSRIEFWSSAARVSLARGRRREALDRLRCAARNVELQRALIPGLELRARSFESHAGVYHEQIPLLAEMPGARVDRVLEVMETARGRSFRELSEDAAPAAREGIRLMRAELASLAKRIETVERSSSTAGDSGVERMRRRARSLERKIGTRVRQIEEVLPGGPRRGAGGTARRVAKALAPEEVFLEYFVAGERVFVAVIAGQRRFLRLLDVPASAARGTLEHLRLQLNTLAATAARPPGNIDFQRRRAEARLQELHRALLQPVLEGLPPGGRLIIVAHDFLHEVPFECLHTGMGYIDDAWEVRRCPTADFFLERRRRDREPPGGPAVVIAGSSHGALQIEEEARQVAERWAPDARRLLIDPEPGQVLQAMEGARLIHISAHGTFRRDNPLFSTLDFRTGMLFLADVLEIRSAAELVVLSACSTGEVLSGRGDALLGVAHAFLARGSRRLIAPLWRVHDEATAQWMHLFYDSYQQGQDPGAALRAAGRALRETWPHPFYWGGFCAIGD